MKLSFIVPFYGNSEERDIILEEFVDCIKKQTLDKELWELVVCEDNMPKTRYQLRDIADVYIKVPHTPLFNKSWHMNCAARRAEGEWLLFMDADCVFGEDYFEKVIKYTEGMPEDQYFFLSWDKIERETGPTNPELYIIDGNRHDCAGGIFAIRKDDYWRIGGMHENYQGHGAEDNDLLNRIMCYPENRLKYVMPYTLIHKYHEWEFAQPKRLNTMFRTMFNTGEIIKRLARASVGNIRHETLIDIKDLPVDYKKLKDMGYSEDELQGARNEGIDNRDNGAGR